MTKLSRSAKRVQTLKEKHGEDFFRKIGRIGGKNTTFHGFADPEVASKAGQKSKRGKVLDA